MGSPVVRSELGGALRRLVFEPTYALVKGVELFCHIKGIEYLLQCIANIGSHLADLLGKALFGNGEVFFGGHLRFNAIHTPCQIGSLLRHCRHNKLLEIVE